MAETQLERRPYGAAFNMGCVCCMARAEKDRLRQRRWMQKMKTENPEKYKEYTRKRNMWRKLHQAK